MNYNEIIIQVANYSASLVFLSREFGGKTTIGTYLKSTSNGQLTKVHGKSAKMARKELLNMEGMARSHGTAVATIGGKQKTVFMSEYFNFSTVA
jgi:hypothetical protein